MHLAAILSPFISMDLQIIFSFQGILGLLVLLSFFYYLWRVTRTNIYKGTMAAPPEVSGAWLIMGHLPQLVGPKQPLFKVLGDMADKYGPAFMVRFGAYPTLVVSSWEMVKECFTTNDRVLASRPASAAGKYLAYDYAMFGFSFYGPFWREVRKISTLELLSHRRLELLKHVPFIEIDTCIKQLYRLWQRNNHGHQGDGNLPVKVNMSKLFGELTLNVVLKLVVGKRLLINDEKADSGDNKDGEKLRETIEEFFKMAGVSVASDALPFLGWLDVDGQKRNMKRIAKEMDIISQKWLEEHRQKRRQHIKSNMEENNVNGAGADKHFMDVLLSVFEGDNADDSNQPFMNYSRDTVIKATSLNTILAASDTTSVTLTWALSLLLNNPRVLREIQNELHMKVGRDRHVEERDIENLVYLQAVVKETLRLYPAAPLSVPHEAAEDCVVGGYHVRAGTRVLVNLWKLHRDPRVWSNPIEFRPERFLYKDECGGSGGKTNLDFRGQHFEYIPFGSGRRMCPGYNFSIQILHMTLARLLHAFELQPAPLSIHNPLHGEHMPVQVVDMTEGPGLTMPKITPLEVLLTPRLPLPLYHH